MFYHINTKDLLNSGEFVKEPVDKICSDINNSSSKKIILSGGRGTGKSIVLQNIENIGINRKNQTIYAIFDPVISFSQIPQQELFFEHYYELVFSLKLLNYIKRYYVLLYEKYFNEYKLFLEKLANETDEYIRKIHYEDIELKSYLKTNEVSSLIVKELKDCLKCDNLSLAIDRFDWINGNSFLAQNIISKYFDLFDKVIVTTDDESLLNIDNRKSFLEKGYTFTDVNYGNDELVVKEIIKRRIQMYNYSVKHRYKKFPVDILTAEIYKEIINKTNGNLSLIIGSVGEVINMWQWKDNKFDLNEQVEYATINQLNTSKTLKKMSKPIKLHL